jgi:hypothetical protein
MAGDDLERIPEGDRQGVGDQRIVVDDQQQWFGLRRGFLQARHRTSVLDIF